MARLPSRVWVLPMARPGTTRRLAIMSPMVWLGDRPTVKVRPVLLPPAFPPRSTTIRPRPPASHSIMAARDATPLVPPSHLTRDIPRLVIAVIPEVVVGVTGVVRPVVVRVVLVLAGVAVVFLVLVVGVLLVVLLVLLSLLLVVVVALRPVLLVVAAIPLAVSLKVSLLVMVVVAGRRNPATAIRMTASTSRSGKSRASLALARVVFPPSRLLVVGDPTAGSSTFGRS